MTQLREDIALPLHVTVGEANAADFGAHVAPGLERSVGPIEW